MIQSLTIHHIALIEELRLTFHQGLHVLSGETGAGKSIVVDAVNLILGGRADKDLIRTGTDKATVEAEFDVPSQSETAALLQREGIDFDGRTVTVYREIARNGRNICRVCGVLMPVAFLKELAPLLMDIHGQHDHTFLLNPDMHLSFLDRMGNEAHQALMRQTAGDCAAFLANHREYAKLVRRNENRQQRLTQLESELRQLRQAKLKPGEEEKLAEEAERLRNAGRIADQLRAAYEALNTGENDISPLSKTREAETAVRQLVPFGGEFGKLLERCESLYYEMEELSYDLYHAMEKAQNDPHRLELVEQRLELIRQLTWQYGSVEEAIQAEKRLELEYEELCGLEDRMEEMAAEHKQLLAAYRKTARALTEARKQLAADFEKRMSLELSELGMGSTQFQVQFAQRDGKPKMPQPTGDDQVEFLISPNPGEPLKPMARIASGGELSRLMLAMKRMEADKSGVQSMVFDEIDTGISGRIAQVVAEKMISISRNCQVICVTHLPQIAAAADYEYLVQKQVIGDRTVTSVTELDERGRIGEVARMISGAGGLTEAAEDYARRMLADSRTLHAAATEA